MISSAWLLTAPEGMGEYVVSIHAEGLESNGDYIVEGTLNSGSMHVVPISSESMNMNATSASEFQADRNGTATYWITINTSPITTFESIELVYLPGMSMQNATVVATVNFSGMMQNSSETVTMMHSSS
ncbi:MAG: hypothetical protein ACREBS_06800 [Nitrososphaerales archaeon]